jgi:hypothetical protein
VARATFTRRHAGGGAKQVALRALVGARSLPPGAYRLDVTARNRAGRQWGPGRVEFTVRGAAP